MSRFLIALSEHYGPDLPFSAAAVLNKTRFRPKLPTVAGVGPLDEWFSARAAAASPEDPIVVVQAPSSRESGERRLPIEVAMEILTDVISQVDVPDEDFVLLPMRELRWLRVLATRWAYRHEFSVERIVDVERRLEADLDVRAPMGRTYRRTIT